jgi:hypothetical protein
MAEKTGPQVVIKRRYEGSNYVGPITYRKIREMRRDPVISLIRTMLFAGVLAGEWSTEIDAERDDLDKETLEEIKAFIHDQLGTQRLHILRTGVLGCFDFGWQGYEKVFDLDEQRLLYTIKKLKPLLQDMTTILTEDKNGAFAGLRSGDIDLSVPESLLLNFDVEGTMWEGQSQIELAEKEYDHKQFIVASAQRYDKKMAGSQWVVRYPVGKTPQPDGTEKENHLIANEILDAIEANGLIALPMARNALTTAENKGQNPWSIELMTANGAVLQFTERFMYQDKSIARVLGWPERAILEGQFGTKAEAEAHGDFVITMIEYRHDSIVELVNWHVVNQLIRINWGEQYENAVWIKATKINDSAKAFLRQLYWKVLENADGFIAEMDKIDLESIAQSLGVPRNDELSEDLPTPTTEDDDPSPTPGGRPSAASVG